MTLRNETPKSQPELPSNYRNYFKFAFNEIIKFRLRAIAAGLMALSRFLASGAALYNMPFITLPYISEQQIEEVVVRHTIKIICITNCLRSDFLDKQRCRLFFERSWPLAKMTARGKNENSHRLTLLFYRRNSSSYCWWIYVVYDQSWPLLWPDPERD